MNFGDSSHKTVEMPNCFRWFEPKRPPQVGIGLRAISVCCKCPKEAVSSDVRIENK